MLTCFVDMLNMLNMFWRHAKLVGDMLTCFGDILNMFLRHFKHVLETC